MAQHNTAPFKTNRSSDKAKSFAAGYGATNLTTIAGKFPAWGPQYTEAHNANASANQSFIGTLSDGTTFTIVLAPGETRPVPVPLIALQAGSGADISVACYWWAFPVKDDQQVVVPINA